MFTASLTGVKKMAKSDTSFNNSAGDPSAALPGDLFCQHRYCRRIVQVRGSARFDLPGAGAG